MADDPSHSGGLWESTGPFHLLIGPLLTRSQAHLTFSFIVFDCSLFAGQAFTGTLFGTLSLVGHVGGGPILVTRCKADPG